jgi:hypothetical protein
MDPTPQPNHTKSQCPTLESLQLNKPHKGPEQYNSLLSEAVSGHGVRSALYQRHMGTVREENPGLCSHSEAVCHVQHRHIVWDMRMTRFLVHALR